MARIPDEKIAEWKEAVEAVGRYMGGSRLGALAEGVTSLLAEREEMLAVLREVEWRVERVYMKGDVRLDTCPMCGQAEPTGHAPDCRLDAVLR